jgi:hypothetical protein
VSGFGLVCARCGRHGTRYFERDHEDFELHGLTSTASYRCVNAQACEQRQLARARKQAHTDRDPLTSSKRARP